MLFERAAIVGVGLIGGSLALAARQAGLMRDILGVGRTEENLRTARARGIIDRYTRELNDVGAVDLVVLAMPIGRTEAIARALVPRLQPGTVVTDVGSVKLPIVRALEPICSDERPFVGAHPIAGSERSGASAAQADLFVGSRCIVTPTERTSPEALARVEALWRGVGAVVEHMDPGAHDRALAWTSHVVHVIAYALAGAIADAAGDTLRYGGPSLRDATRVAASSPELWADILLTNADEVAAVTASFGHALERLRAAVLARDESALRGLLNQGHLARRTLEKLTP